MQIKNFTKKNVYSELAKELMVLAELDGAQSTCLDIIKDLSDDIQVKILSNLAGSNNPNLIPFFQFVIKEMEGDLKRISEKAIKKYQYLGYKITPSEFQKGPIKIVQAFASPTRLEGNCLLVFLTKVDNRCQAHYFTLAFNHMGIKEYFQYKSTNRIDINNSIRSQKLTEISIDEGKILLRDALQQNEKFRTKCATGFNQYRVFLDDICTNLVVDYYQLTKKLWTKRLSPTRLINAYLIALKNMDAGLIYDLSHASLKGVFGERGNFIKNWVNPFEKYTFIKTIPIQWNEQNDTMFNETQIVASGENDELKKISLEFVLINENGQWSITEVKVVDIQHISDEDCLNPLNYHIYTDIYRIDNSDKISREFDNWNNVHLTGEFDKGLCYKWFKNRNPVENGINVFDDVFGEFILTDHELIIFSSKRKNLTQISYEVNKKTNGLKGLKIKLDKRNICSVREVYKVITNPRQLLSYTITRDSEIIYIPELAREEWYNFFINNYSETFILDDKTKVFQIERNDVEIEGMFYGQSLVVFIFNTTLEDARKRIANIPETEFCNISKIQEDYQGKTNWNNLKLICKLKNDQFLKLYVPLINKRLLAKQMGILVQ